MELRKTESSDKTWPRLLFVDHTAQVSGAELLLAEIVLGYKGTCTVLLFSDGPLRQRFESMGIEVIVWPESARLLKLSRRSSLWSIIQALGDAWRLALRLRKLMKGFDMVGAHSQKAFAMCALAKPLYRKPLLWYLYDILDCQEFSSIGVRLQVALANRFADGVVLPSYSCLDGYLGSGGSREIAQVVYLGIDPTPFDAIRPDQVAQLREKLGLTNKVVIGCFSRLTPWKGQHLLIDSMPALPQDTYLLLGGGAMFGEHEYEAMLRARTRDLNLEKRILFQGTLDYEKEIPVYVKACDIIVHAATSPEPFGRVILEGMVARKPVVAPDCGGPAEVIENAQTGLLYRTGDRESLQSQLLRLVAEPQIAKAIGERAYEHATAAFSMGAMQQKQADFVRLQWERLDP